MNVANAELELTKQIGTLVKVMWVVAGAFLTGIAALFVVGWNARDILVTKQDLKDVQVQIGEDVADVRRDLGEDITNVGKELSAAEARVTTATKESEARVVKGLDEIKRQIAEQ